MRLPLDAPGRHDRAGQPRRSSAGRATRARSCVGRRRFQDLLTAGGRIYHETHYAPLLRMQGAVREIAVEIVRADGTPAAGAGQLGAAQRRGRARRSVDPHDGVRRDRPAPATSGSCCARAARASTRSPHASCSASLLAGALPAGDRRCEVGVRLPAGGQRPRGRRRLVRRVRARRRHAVGLVVGDVVGRGHATRRRRWGSCAARCARWRRPALAPGRAARRARRATSSRHGVGRMATVVYAEVDSARGALTLRLRRPSAAGDRRAPGGRRASVGRAARRRSTSHAAGDPRRAEATLDARARAAPWCSTPTGWSSAAGEPLDAGSRRCWPASSAAAAWTRPARAEHLLGDLAGRGPHRDDVCVLVATLSAA